MVRTYASKPEMANNSIIISILASIVPSRLSPPCDSLLPPDSQLRHLIVTLMPPWCYFDATWKLPPLLKLSRCLAVWKWKQCSRSTWHCTEQWRQILSITSCSKLDIWELGDGDDIMPLFAIEWMTPPVISIVHLIMKAGNDLTLQQSLSLSACTLYINGFVYAWKWQN